MLIIVFGIKGFDRKEFVLTGQTVNSAYDCEVLRRLPENVRRLRPKLWRQKNWLLHHDNGQFYTSSFTGEYLTKHNITLVPHPPKTPDMAPCDVYQLSGLVIKL
jgi:histone-lysine N-methyltransferase SETMAR